VDARPTWQAKAPAPSGNALKALIFGEICKPSGRLKGGCGQGWPPYLRYVRIFGMMEKFREYQLSAPALPL